MPATTNLSKPFRKTEDGTVVTVADAIVELLAAGNYIETAAAAVGINRTNLQRLLARGGKALRAHAMTGRAVPKPEKVYAEFADRVQTAVAQSEAVAVATLAALANGGLVVSEVSIEYVIDESAAGGRREVKRTESSRTLAPNARALMWRLERRGMKRWGRAGSLEPVTDDGGPIPTREEKLEAIEAALRDYEVGFEDGKASASVE